MAEGISLHLGVNRVDPSHYRGFRQQDRWEGDLRGCEQDALDLEAIAAAEGFRASSLLTKAANTEDVAAAVAEGAASLEKGDMFVLTFSGYGGHVPDRNSDQHWNEATWALYDRQMPEDELMSLLASFRAGVRVLVIDDSSAAGTMRRDIPLPVELSGVREPRPKALPPDVVSETYRSDPALYDAIQSECTSSDQAVIDAAVLVMTGFSPNQFGEEGARNGVFTGTLLRVWNGGRFRGDYDRFVEKIAALMSSNQIPHLTQRGSGKSFLGQRPLTI